MRHFDFILALVAASPVFGERCDNHNYTEIPARFNMGGVTAMQAAAPPPVELFIHIVAASNNRAEGYLTAADVDSQIKAVRDVYTGQGITFRHNAATQRKWYVRPEYTGQSPPLDTMKTELHVGNYQTLNLYLVHVTEPNWGGTCPNPWRQTMIEPNLTKRLKLSGCVVNSRTIPGSSHPFMNQGKSAVHEIGHWFGLWHPWEDQGIRNGVGPPNPCWIGNPDDDVADTPKMGWQVEGTCDEEADTCPDQPGKDPVHNYMGYGADSCMNQFTPGQKERMYYIYENYRANFTHTV